MFEPVKVGFGEFLQHFYADLVGTTKQVTEFKRRGFPYSFVYAPSRMVDKVDEMLATWQRNDTNQSNTQPSKLPVVICAFAKDYSPTGRDYTIQISDGLDIMIPEDGKQRCFKVKTISGDLRVQLAICTADEPSAKSIAAQFLLFLDNINRRGFNAIYQFAGIDVEFPCQIEAPDNPASNIETGNNNITILSLDLNLKCTVPLYESPDLDDPDADGTGTDNVTDPSGYKVVDSISLDNKTVKHQRKADGSA